MGLPFQGLNTPALPCPAGGPHAPGQASSQENQLGSVCAAGPRWGFRGAASFPRAVGASELFLQFYPTQSSGWCGWRVKSWWHCQPRAAAAPEWLESANFFFFPLCPRVSKQLSCTWIIFPTFCSRLCDLVACFYRKEESFMSLGESGRSFWKRSQVLNRVCQRFGE